MTADAVKERLADVYPVSRETLERLEVYVSRLTEWQKKTNLVAPSTLDDIWSRHIADSLQCVAIKSDADHWLDLGSGGGLPGMIIAAVKADEPDTTVTLVESNMKKSAFLRQVARQMGVSVTVISERIERVEPFEPAPEIVTARALTALPNLLELAAPWLLNGAIGLFHKGREYDRELADCDGLWRFDLVKHDSSISGDSVILEITNLQRS